MLDEFTPQASRSTGRPRRRWGRRVLAMLLALVFLVVASVGAYLLYLNHTVTSNVRHEALLPEDEGTDTGPAIPRGKGENYLILGSDARPGDTVSRADVIIVAHIPKDRKKVYLVHFPRDLYVSIPGHGKNKINAAYAFGRAPLLVRTIEQLIDVRIDHVAKTDFNGFKAMTDAVGGVHVYAEEASNGRGNGGPVVIRKGWNDLDGEQALAFVRERYQLSEGDISRGRRQMAFLKALLQKVVSRETLTSPVRIADFTDAATKNLVVDNGFTIEKMRSETLAMRGIRSKDVVFVTAPFTGFGTSPQGASIDIVNLPAMKELGTALRNDDMGSYTDVSVIP